ncbi:type II toxin-antitoxin system RelE/ParE family toxin [Hydrogenophaga sp.]|uniref:type II toxin-antitoxin system RelE/ParE family toxin n=1 Tax=Hydrogenophaga sp. TaxID=1904254 RepID=UPI002725FB89|nr:type II toxin-antitoxin system RelE/ParE family toxin [Hydrogenophaga sp.]MDO9437830.1 type II toxin-antitoxin system RelE/ParE family toxin [Hydrogenophaga sp.]
MLTVVETEAFSRWLAGLKDPSTRIRLARRLEKVTRGQLGDVKPVGGGVHEMREFFGAGWRMYYTEREGILIIMLGGGDKSSQTKDIQRARQLAKEL